MLRAVLDRFWNEDFWLPPNTTWQDVTPGPDKDVAYTDWRHLWYPIPMALALLVLRYFLEAYIYVPFGKSLGIKNTHSKEAPPNPKLEAAYMAATNIQSKQICSLAKQLDMTERQVERWWRLRRSQDKPSTLVKFCENLWQTTFYLYNVSSGLYIMWDKPWLWDIDHCYIGYPNQGITNDVWWYYMVSFAFYSSLTMSQFWDVKRKDFWQVFIHHAATIALFQFSWVCNFHRVGTLIILSHESGEIWLAMAKATKYAKYQRLCDILFLVFMLMWIITRTGYYPFYIIWSTLYRRPHFVPNFPASYVLNGLLMLLMCLHVLWTWLILQVAYKMLINGQMEKDIRSSSSEVSDDGPEQPKICFSVS